MPGLVATARTKAFAGYVGDGTHRWAATHRDDAGAVVRLALEKKVPAGTVLHATAETGVPMREIAEAIGRGLDVPAGSVPEDQAGAHFGWLGKFAGADMAAASDTTRSLLGWTPSGPSLAEDLGSYL